MKAMTAAQWFLRENPSLQNGYRDENTKLNKLLYFSNLMAYSVREEDLIDEPFERWDHGPVVRGIYVAYRYHGLSKNPGNPEPIHDRQDLQILEIVNFVFGDLSGRELSEESHKSAIWQEPERNEILDFSKIDAGEKQFMQNLYETYKDFDFANCGVEKIAGNKYFYDKRNMTITDDISMELATMPEMEAPVFLEIIDGELVFS